MDKVIAGTSDVEVRELMNQTDQGEDFDSRWVGLEDFFGDYDREYRETRITKKPDWPPKEEVDVVLQEVCELYLATDGPGRQRIRRFFQDSYFLGYSLIGFIGTASRWLRETGNATWLELGLAAASIEDNRNDFRDTYRELGELYLEAVLAGLEPGPEFRRMAALSSPGLGIERISMRVFLESFEDSGYFQIVGSPS